MIPVVMPVYNRADVVFERGEGPYLFDTAGRRYLDFAAGVAVVALGHSHPHLVNALVEQGRKLWHTSNLYRVAGQESLAQRLVDATFADTVFFTNSGVEAWECSVKVCRKYQYETGNPQRWRIITFQQNFHGRTTSAIAASKAEKMVKGFGPVTDGFDMVAFGNLNEVRAAITDETAAICVEPIQGEGGIRVGDTDFLKGLRAVCDEFGLLLFMDEIQTGMGRTGKLFAHEWAGVTPDVMAVAKGIGGGFPLGACLATEKAAVGMTPGTHGSTYGGNPLATAIGNAVLDVMLAPGFLQGVEKVGRTLHRRLAGLVDAHPQVYGGVRGHGLMLGLECVPANTAVVDRLRANGMLAVAAGDNVVRLLPPLIIDEAQVDEAVAILGKTAQELVG
ncbi:aspartate aminotransferase family protein [Azospirillum sp.]|uniref:aspartate aminotransferase family protein n=1 Tax=Azospirillum sp. TaxID=34012 RepID=UPI002D4E59FA|nr:aspartate aminotransferase family protein [Azospirillum sp.]HYD68681.1 aspartate aminotransferase family protein [Azospirillum sp.]